MKSDGLGSAWGFGLDIARSSIVAQTGTSAAPGGPIYVTRKRAFALLATALLGLAAEGCSARRQKDGPPPRSDGGLVVRPAQVAAMEAGLPPQFAALRNSDVVWNGDYVGWSPSVHGDAAQQVRGAGARSVPHLKRLLADPDRYIVAHVLLTELDGRRHELFPTYNQLQPHGHRDQRAILCQLWKADCGSISLADAGDAGTAADAARP